MQQFALVHHAHRRQEFLEQRTNRGLTQVAWPTLLAGADDEVLQTVALQKIHHHVHGSVGGKEVQHAADPGVRNFCQRPPFMEKTLQTQAVQAQFVGAGLGVGRAADAAGEGGGQVFLDGDLLVLRVSGEVDDAESTHSQVAHNPVALHKRAGRKGCGLLHERVRAANR